MIRFFSKSSFSIKALLFIICFGWCSVSYSQVRERMERRNDNRIFYYDEYGWRVSVSLGTMFADKLDIFFDDTCTQSFSSDENFHISKEICPEMNPNNGNPPSPSGSVETHTHDYLAPVELEESYPSAALRLEYKPFRGLSADFETAYFRHKIGGGIQQVRRCSPSDGSSDTQSYDCIYSGSGFEGNRSNILVTVGGDYSFDNSSIVTPYISASVGVSNSFIDLMLDLGKVSDWELIPVGQVGAGVDFDVGPLILGTNYNFVYLGGHTFDYEIQDAEKLRKEKGVIALRNNQGHRVELKIGLRKAVF